MKKSKNYKTKFLKELSDRIKGFIKFRYNYETDSTLFGLKELTIDDKSKHYFINGYIVEQSTIIKTVLLSNFTYLEYFSGLLKNISNSLLSLRKYKSLPFLTT